MPFPSISSLRPGALGLTTALTAALIVMGVGGAHGFEILPDPATDASVVADGSYDLYLSVSINGVPRDMIAPIHQEADGSLAASADDLIKMGLLPPKSPSALPDGKIPLTALPGVTYTFDAAQQSIDFTAPDSARVRLIVRASGADTEDAAADAPPKRRGADFGALLNYDIYFGASRMDGGSVSYDAPAGSFDARVFGPFGLFDQTFAASSATQQVQRLNSTWSMSDPDAMRTYRAGDIATGALSWTRPTRLGGIQVQNDFALRSDIITYPVPSLSGSAALPSSVDIYVNNAERYSGSVPAGPFDIVDVPVVTGSGTVQLVVRDATGKQVVTSADYFASPQLLRPGLWDYSAEAGFARTHFGSDGDGYDSRLMGSASIRTGISDWLTWEGHAEGGGDLLNAGTGVVMAIGRLGTGEFSVAGSRTAEATGVQVSGSLQLSFGPVSVGAHAQRSFGRFEDIASFTTPGVTDHSSPAPAALYQASISVPTPFAAGRASLSYTDSEPATGEAAQILAVSYGQRLFAGSASASAYKDFHSGNFGVTASLWMPVGKDMAAGASASRSSSGTVLTADIGHAASDVAGDLGWLLRVNRDDQSDWSASAREKFPLATLRAQASHVSNETSLAAEVSGSVVAAGGGVFFANPVDDAFAVVDAGAPGVPVLLENRPVGVTGGNGKLLVPGLSAYQKNRISIDPSKLPLNAVVDDTTEYVSPAHGSGVVVGFGDHSSGGTALVSFRDVSGKYLPLASAGQADGGKEFVVGYDGQALIEGLGPQNSVTITMPDGSACTADVAFAPHGTDLVNIPDVVCHPS